MLRQLPVRPAFFMHISFGLIKRNAAFLAADYFIWEGANNH